MKNLNLVYEMIAKGIKKSDLEYPCDHCSMLKYIDESKTCSFPPFINGYCIFDMIEWLDKEITR